MGDIGGRGSRMVSGAPPKGHWRASPKNLGTSYAGGQELLAGIQVVQVSNAHRWDFPSDIERLNALVESGLTGAGNTYIYISPQGLGRDRAGPCWAPGPTMAHMGPPGPSSARARARDDGGIYSPAPQVRAQTIVNAPEWMFGFDSHSLRHVSGPCA